MSKITIFFQVCIWLMVFFTPWESFAITLNTLTLRLYQIIIILIVCFAIPRIIQYHNHRKLWTLDTIYSYIHSLLFIGIWITMAISTVIYTDNAVQILVKTGVLGIFIVSMIILVSFYNTPRFFQRYFLTPIFLSTGVLILIGLYESIAFQVSLPSLQVFPGRVDSLLPEPNWFGMWLSIAYGLVLPVVFREKHYTVKISLWALLLGIILMNILTITRASWLAMFLVTALYLGYLIIRYYQEWGRVLRFISIWIVVIFGAISMSMLGLTEFNLQDRVMSILSQNTRFYSVIDPDTQQQVSVDQEDIQEQSLDQDTLIIEEKKDVNVVSRLDGYREALILVQNYPVFGIGLNGYENKIGEGKNPNNIFLSILVSGGIVSLAFFVTFLYIILKQSVLLYRTLPEYTEIIFLTMTSLIVTGQFNDNFLMGFVWLTFGMWAMLINIGFMYKESIE